MSNAEILTVLKQDLHISSTAYDTLLNNLISSAQSEIERTGIVLDTNSISDGMIVEMYAAWVYRKRAENTPLPRYLQFQIHNRLLSQKAQEEDDD